MTAQVRPFSAQDYPALVALNQAVYPEYRETAEEIRHYDERVDPDRPRARWVVDGAGSLLAMGYYQQARHDPHRFWIEIFVRPEARGRGIGSALYRHLNEALTPFAPTRLRAGVREDQVDGITFLKRRGFVEDMRDWESRLSVVSFDPALYAAVEEKVASEGIVIRTLAELASDPERDRKLYDLDCEVDEDIPRTEPFAPRPFDHFAEHLRSRPGRLPDGYFVACDGEHYVGLSTLSATADPAVLDTGLTGVRRPYRGRGIAMALKVRALSYAKSLGVAEVRTWNASNNRPMLGINQRLGFAREAAWIEYVKVF